MARLVFKVSADWEEVKRLREEVVKLKAEVKGIDSGKFPAQAKELNNRIGEADKRLKELTKGAVEAGAKVENSFKKKIFDASNVVNGFSMQITKQRGEIFKLKNELSGLKEKYRQAVKSGANTNGLESQIAKVNKRLSEHKNRLFDLTQKQADARLSVKKLRDEYALFKDDTVGASNAVSGFGLNITKGLALIGGGAAIKGLVSEIVRVRGEFQQMDTAIKTLLGSKEKADALLAEVKEYAKISPLELKSISSATQMMLGFNIEAEKVPKFIKAIGDASMGDTGRFNSLTLSFSQMSAAGKLMGQDLNQMINAGFNPLTVMAEKTGKSVAQLKDEMSKGAISAEMVQQAFIDATSAGGKFYKMSENAAAEINGQLSMLQDSMDAMFNNLGKASEGAIKSAISGATLLIENYETVGKVIMGLVATYGTYRTAVMLTTLAENGLTKARVLGRLAQIKLTQAITSGALASAAVTGAYVALAAAVVGVSYGMYKVATYESEFEKAHKRLGETSKSVEASVLQEAKSLQELERRLIEAEKGSKEYENAKRDIVSGYGKYFDGLDAEIDKVGNLSTAYDKLIDSVRGSIAERRMADYINSEESNFQKAQEETLNRAYDELMSKYGKDEGKRLYGELFARVVRGKELSRDDFNKIRNTTYWELGFDGSPIGVQQKSVSSLISKIDREKKAKDDAIEKFKDLYQIKDKTGTGGKESAVTQSLKEDYEKAKNDWEKAKSELQKIDKDKANYTAKQREEAEKNLKATKEAFEKLGGETSDGAKGQKFDLFGATLDMNEAQRKKLLEASRKKQDLIFQIEQQEINALGDSSEKRMRQRALDNAKEIQDLERQKEDYISQLVSNAKEKHDAEEKIKESSTKGYKKKAFNPSAVNIDTDEVKRFDELIRATRHRQSIDQYAPLIKEYQSYADQRLEIERKFDEDIKRLRDERAKAEAAEDTESINILSRSIAKATSDRGKALMDHDFNALKQSPEYSRAFDDLRNTSSSTIKALILELERYKSQVSSSLNPSDLKAYTDAIRQMYDELDSRSPFDALVRSLEDLESSEDTLKSAKETLSAVQNGAKIIKGMELDRGTGKANVTYLSEAEALKILSKAQDGYVRATNRADKARSTAIGSVKALSSAIGELGGSIGGLGGDIINLIGDFTSFVSVSVDGITKVAKTGEAAISAVEKASVILTIISAAINLMRKLSELTPDAHKEYKKIEEKERAISRLTSAVNDYRRAVIEARHEDENWFSSDSLKSLRDSAELYDRAKEAYAKKLSEKQSAYVDKGVNGWLGKSLPNEYMLSDIAKKRAGDGTARSNMRIETRSKSNGFLGTGIGGHNQETENLEYWVRDNFGKELFDENNAINRELVKQIMEKFGDKLVGQTKETLEELDKLQEQIDQYQKALRDYVVDSYSPLVDNFVDGVWNSWVDGGKDAMDYVNDYASKTFADIAKSMVKSMLLKDIFEKQKDQILGIADRYAKGEIDFKKVIEESKKIFSESASKLKEQAPLIMSMLDQIDEAFKKDGIDIRGGDANTQDSTKRGFETMTQDQAGELNGRFTALQVLGEEKKGLHIITNELLREISTKVGVGALSGIGDKSREIIADGYKANINIVFPDAKIDALTSEVVSLRGVVTDMQRMSSEALLEAKETSENVAVLAKQGRELVDSNNSIKQNTSRL